MSRLKSGIHERGHINAQASLLFSNANHKRHKCSKNVYRKTVQCSTCQKAIAINTDLKLYHASLIDATRLRYLWTDNERGRQVINARAYDAN